MLNGNRLREVRKAKGLTQTELGELIGVGKSAICCYEKETRNPTLEAVIEMIHVRRICFFNQRRSYFY